MFRSTAMVVLAFVVAAACSGSNRPISSSDSALARSELPSTGGGLDGDELAAGVVGGAAAEAEPTPAPTPEPTPTPRPNRPPRLVVQDEIRAEIDKLTSLRAEAVDADGEVVELRLEDPPEGVEELAAGVWAWTPFEPGTWESAVVATDDDGAAVRVPVTFRSRYDSRSDLLLGLGDSIASGHGLDRSDYLGRDSCWRDEGDSYPRQVYDLLVRLGRIGDASGAFALVACSGADIDDLWIDPVTGGPGDVADDRLTQLDWAIRSNPGFITLTIGVNDLGFVRPRRLINDDGTLDRPELDARLDVVEADLRRLLGELVGGTDATIAVTNYYNPTAMRPQGFDGCRTDCFRAHSETVLGELNGVIAAVVADFGPRLVHVDLRKPFEGHGAPNGLGPDGIRHGDAGILTGLVDIPVETVQAYCARGETEGEPWVSAIDCVHPNATGTARIADAVVQALLE